MFPLILMAWILTTLNAPEIIWVCYAIWTVIWAITLGVKLINA